jgi:predicted ATPase/DNA-binding CsgD family transcriptional regulator
VRKTGAVGLDTTQLTDQEWHIASLVGAGSSNKAVARDLKISIKTVEFHLSNVYRKLGIRTRAELAYLIGSNSPRIVGRSHIAGNLPRERSALIGRDGNVADVMRLVTEWPLVTLTGSAGVGKTRLAIAAGRAASDQFGDGVWMVELGSVADGRDLSNASAIALGLNMRSSASTAADVASALGRQRRLIILDNCEHVIAAAAALARAIVTACPNVVVLATSRERLNMADEHLLPVPPMSVDPIDGVSPAARLFVTRANEVLGSFDPSDRDRDAVNEVCRRLDGLPLAIELAAARLVGLGVHEIQDRLDDRFELLAQRRPESDRHRSLLTTIEWSYDLLSRDEQRTFESLAVFIGDFDSAAAYAVSDQSIAQRQLEDHLASLVEKSMVIARDHSSGRRYLLLETLREFALRRLDERGETAAVRRRHLDHFCEFLHRTDIGMRGSNELSAHQAMLTEWHNLRVAVSTACELDDGSVASQLITDVLWWAITRMRAEVGEWADRVRLLPSIVGQPPRNIPTIAAAFFAYMRNDLSAGKALIASARADEALFGELADPWISAVEVFLSSDPISMTFETQRRARANNNEFWHVLGILQEGVLRSEYVSLTELEPAELAEHLARITRGLEKAEQYGNPNGIAYGKRNLGGAIWKTDPERARPLLEQALATAVPLGLELLAGQTRSALARLLTSEGRPWDALRLMAVAIEAHIRTGAVSELDLDLATCAGCFVTIGDLHLAKVIVDAIHGAKADVYDSYLAGLDSHITSALDLMVDDGSGATVAGIDLVEAAGRVIAAVHAG